MRGLLLIVLASSASAQPVLLESFAGPLDDAGWTKGVGTAGGEESIADAGRVGRGWLIVRSDAGVGVANRTPCYRRDFDAGTSTGPVTVRYWLDATSTNGQFGMFPVIIQSAVNTLAEVRFVQSGLGYAPILQCTDRQGTFRVCSSMSVPQLQGDSWHLVELSLEGAGTANGSCTGAIDGIPFCTQSQDWSTLRPERAFIGLCALDQAWAGSMSVDELRISTLPQASMLRISSPVDAGIQGDCVPFTIDAIDTFQGSRATVAVATTLSRVVVDGGLGFFATAGCNTVAPIPALTPNNAQWSFFVRAGSGPSLEVNASAIDLAPTLARFSLPLVPAVDSGVPDSGVPDSGAPDSGVPDSGVPDSGVPDSGVPDSGVPDSGVPDSGVPDSGVPDSGAPDSGSGERDAGMPTLTRSLNVGCGCAGAPMLQILAALALLYRRSRR